MSLALWGKKEKEKNKQNKTYKEKKTFKRKERKKKEEEEEAIYSFPSLRESSETPGALDRRD